MAVTMKNVVFWDVTPCGSAITKPSHWSLSCAKATYILKQQLFTLPSISRFPKLSFPLGFSITAFPSVERRGSI
jgi:hypothetical protein